MFEGLNVSGITSKMQCTKIGNEHDLALDVFTANGEGKNEKQTSKEKF